MTIGHNNTQLRFWADDFGGHPSIDRAIINLVNKRVIQGVSILVSSPHFDPSSLEELLRHDVKIGVHLAFTDTVVVGGVKDRYPWIKEGFFIRHWRDMIFPLLFKSLPKDLLFEEWSAQVEKLKRYCSDIYVVDSHQNLHLLPQFASTALRIRAAFSIPFVRVLADNINIFKPACTFLNYFGRWYFDRSISLPMIGSYYSGQLSYNSLKSLIGLSSERKIEDFILTHPGEDDEIIPYNYQLKWRQEYELLLDETNLQNLREIQ